MVTPPALVKDKIGRAEFHAPAPAKPRPQVSAYECYVKGRQAWLTSDKRELDPVQEWFEQARARYLEIRKRLMDEPVGPERSRLVDEMYRISALEGI